MLGRAAPLLGADKFDAAGVEQFFYVVANLADALTDDLGDFIGACRAFVEDREGVDPDQPCLNT